MINFLQNAFVFFIFATPIMAATALLASFFGKQLRQGILPGLIGTGLGFCLGVSLGGGFGQTEGWGWGNVGAAIFGLCYAATGFFNWVRRNQRQISTQRRLADRNSWHGISASSSRTNG